MRAELFYADRQTDIYIWRSYKFVLEFLRRGLKTEENGRFGRRRAHKCDINVNWVDIGIEGVDNTSLA